MLIDCLYLVSKGVPFDVAFALPDDERHAWIVIFGTLEGGKYDWPTQTWQ